MKPNVPFRFDKNCQQTFSDLCKQLVSSPVLAIYNPNKETELHCDASSGGFGGILVQRQDDGKFHPVGYFSRATTPAESKYHSYELDISYCIFFTKISYPT